MNEQLLTPDEIDSILTQAKHPDWLMPNLVGGGPKRSSLFRVKPDKNLILITGDASTGLAHITERHRFNRQVWRDDKDELDDSSEIRLAPFYYIDIAESIYKQENLQSAKNKRADVFDLYQGEHLYPNGNWVAYKLITYKGTGIIHTLYPLKSDNKSKKLLLYRQCGTGMVNDLMRGSFLYTVPYKDKSGRIVFSLLIRGLRSHPLERWYIQIHEGNHPINPQTIFYREIKLYYPEDHVAIRSTQISWSAKSSIEQAALQVLKQTFDYNTSPSLHVTANRITANPPTYFYW